MKNKKYKFIMILLALALMFYAKFKIDDRNRKTIEVLDELDD